MSERISLSIEGGVADVRLTRADKMNALDDAMFEALISTGERLSQEKGVRAVVISGEGRAFCAGLDMGNFGRMAAPKEKEESKSESSMIGRLEKRTHGIANRPQHAVWVWRELPVPVIAAVHGTAFGGGFQLMLGADMRYVAPDTRLSIMEIKWGLVPDMAGTQIMRHLVREDIVRELTYTGRIFSGEEAGQYGFATRVTANPREEALATAREIAGKSPDAIRAAKRLLNLAPVAEPVAGLIAESVEQDRLIGSPNQIEAIMSNLEKRAANYKD
ncbi:MAG TPA: crotonase/enoyl-CoA hydratase family protein [Parvibaculum sp.]|uniref:crotonase/enoyl-CoA hydratase family protein n=1 Tax=Parvibaculum sp. TaxID=2024848 RepID=UPI002BDE0074|nr:crotonase/enoyl-CoA hydratase family protein [Parvibaculum sp.]HMM15638.1 crotonase/enoyl-CoA hydratase family protein [Parvibaculum sp.]